MAPTRGRPSKIDHDHVQKTILEHKSVVINRDNKILSKLDKLWFTLSAAVNMTPDTLYSYVSCNRNNIRNILLAEIADVVDVTTLNITPDCDSSAMDTSAGGEEEPGNAENLSKSPANEEKVEMFMSRREFDDLVEYRLYNRREKERKFLKVRRYAVWKPGEWEKMIINKLKPKKINCGFQFKKHKLTMTKHEATFDGKCKCGAGIEGKLENTNQEVIPIKCTITFPSVDNGEECGKRYLREPERTQLAKHLCDTHTLPNVHRIRTAAKTMGEGDPEPCDLYSNKVIGQAVSEYKKSKYLHNDPTQALALAQQGNLKCVIRKLGRNPFSVQFWSNHQIHVYRTYCEVDHSYVTIDATGGVARRITHADGTESRGILLYVAVVRGSCGQFIVSSFLSEDQDAVSIQHWLLTWQKTGAPPPKEVVCDASKAILIALIRAYTPYKTIHEYCDGCRHGNLPRCYIRIDVAHFIKTYANFLKDEKPMVKNFFLATIGQLILVRNEKDAETYLKYIFTISLSETEGFTRDGTKTHCEIYKDELKDFLTGETSTLIDSNESDGDHDVNVDDEEEDEESDSQDGWYEWANEIFSEAKAIVARERGVRTNAHYVPKLAARLLSDLKQFPMWSCVLRDKFGYGRVPASSAPVESEFGNLKNRLLRNYSLPLRVDELVDILEDYIKGRIKIADAQYAKLKPSETQGDTTEVLPTLRNQRCEECANGNFPDETRKCAICTIPIHVFEGCSVLRIGEEGYGCRRICVSCDSLSEENLVEIISSQEKEGWGGEAARDEEKSQKKEKKSQKEEKKGRKEEKKSQEEEKKSQKEEKKGQKEEKKTSLYLNRDFVKNQFITDGKVRAIPILTNGHKTKNAVVVKNQSISLSNTCNFDGHFQIFLCASFDYPSVEDKIEAASAENEFFQMVSKVRNGGITSSTYNIRTLILLKSSSKRKDQGNGCIIIDCTTDTKAMFSLLLHNAPSVREISTCDTCCQSRSELFHLIPVEISSFSHELINSWLDDRFCFTKDGSCSTAGCSGLVTTKISEIGKFIALEIFSETDQVPAPVKLSTIPLEIQAACMTNKYVLCGLLNYHPSARTRRSADLSDYEPTGHYTAVCRRKNGSWIEYDDLKTDDRPKTKKKGQASDKRNETYKVIPDLAIFVEMPIC